MVSALNFLFSEVGVELAEDEENESVNEEEELGVEYVEEESIFPLLLLLANVVVGTGGIQKNNDV